MPPAGGLGSPPPSTPAGPCLGMAGGSPAAQARQAAAANTNNPDVAMDELDRQMQGLMVSDMTAESGFNFTSLPPRIWWTFTHNGVRYIRYDFCVWGEFEESFKAKPALDGKSLRVYCQLPPRFIDMTRVLYQYNHIQYFAAAIAAGDTSGITDGMWQQGVNIMQKIADTFDLAESIKPMTEIKLPFQVMQNPHDPYDPDGPGTLLSSYPITQGEARRFFVYSVYLRAADCARTPSSARYTERNF